MALRFLPRPEGITWQDWVSAVVWLNPSTINTVSPDVDWRQFADQLNLTEADVPRAEIFNTWQDWAVALKNAYQL